MRASFDYDAVLATWRLLSAAAYEQKMAGDEDDPDGLADFLDESTEKLLLLTDDLRYEDIADDGQLTGPAMNIAMLEGWNMTLCDDVGPGFDKLLIEDDPDSDTFENAASARAFVEARAASGERGTKLHQIALKLAAAGGPS